MEIKDGKKTSEGQGSAAVIAGTAVAAGLGLLEPESAARISAAVIMVYTIARAIVKFTATKLDDKALKEVKAVIVKTKKRKK